MTSPSGEQFEIAFGDQRAVVVEAGCGLRSYEVGGTPVLDGYGEDEMCRSGRGQVLAPWPNRLHDGSYEFGGRRLQLPINDLATNGAIHGLVRWANWRVRDRDGAGVVMAYRLHPQPGYPFTLDIEIAYRLADDGLSVDDDGDQRRRRAVSLRKRRPPLPDPRAARRRHRPARAGARRLRLPRAAADRRHGARQLLRRSGARRGRARARHAGRLTPSRCGSSPGLRLPHGLHGRPAARREPAR